MTLGGVIGGGLAYEATAKVWSQASGGQGGEAAVLITPVLFIVYVGKGTLIGIGSGFAAGTLVGFYRARRAKPSLEV